jgi:CubicO group peptidase (beta-lactamase class C family)
MTELPTAKPHDVGLDAAQLARADRHLARYIEKGLLPGALLAIARHGRIAHFSVQGLMDRERGRTLSQDTLFRIYSMTKPITSVALMTLFEEGLFQLDDPVAKYIPAFANLGVHAGGSLGSFKTTAPARQITLRDLFIHMSGLTYGIQRRTAVDAAYRERRLDDYAGPLNEWIKALAEMPLEFSVELFRLNRCAGAHRRSADRRALRRASTQTDFRAARHEGHGVLRAAREGRSPGGLLPAQRGRHDRVGR